MEGRTEPVGHSTATAKTTADCVRFDKVVTATISRRQGYGRQAGAWPSRWVDPKRASSFTTHLNALGTNLRQGYGWQAARSTMIL